MNPALLLLLAGGAVAVAVAASSSSSGPSVVEQPTGLLGSSDTMIRIFELYSKQMENLTNDELDELGKINAAAKGIQFKTAKDFAFEYKGEEAWFYVYRRTYYLPPGAEYVENPDMFSAWAKGTGNLSDTLHTTPDPYAAIVRIPQSQPTAIDRVCNDTRRADCYTTEFYDWFDRKIGFIVQDNTVHGQSDLMVIVDGYAKGFKDIWSAVGKELLKEVAAVASNYPGIGTAISVAVTFLEQIGSGASIENASIAAGRNAVPSAFRAAYDIGVGLATQGKLDVDAALKVAMAAAISTGVITGDVLEKYNTAKASYEQAKAVGVEIKDDLGQLGDAIQIAQAAAKAA